jgi:phosphatidate cytidylyltransferase
LSTFAEKKVALNLPVFYQRTGSAIVFGIIMLAGLLWNEVSFFALICLVEVLCMKEYFSLVKKINTTNHWPLWIELLIHATGLCALALLFFNQHRYLLFIVPVITATGFITAAISKKEAIAAWQTAWWGLWYITLPMVSLLIMYRINPYLPLALILMIWSNDTLAYLVGSFIGKTPFSSISPKKTWEGTAGGALLTMAGAAAFGWWAHTTPAYSPIHWILIGLCATVAGTLGDLLESKLKRMAGVKDSGAIMPGHGGALDRFDSLIVAAPFACVYATLFLPLP